jgi:hypothetical protein
MNTTKDAVENTSCWKNKTVVMCLFALIVLIAFIFTVDGTGLHKK